MNPWHLSSRTLAARYLSLRRLPSTDGKLRRWHAPLMQRSYSNIPDEIQQDERPRPARSPEPTTTFQPFGDGDGVSEGDRSVSDASDANEKPSKARKRRPVQVARRRLKMKAARKQKPSVTLSQLRSHLESQLGQSGKQRPSLTLHRLKGRLESHLARPEERRSNTTLNRLREELERHLTRHAAPARLPTRKPRIAAQRARPVERHGVKRVRIQTTHAIFREKRAKRIMKATRKQKKSGSLVKPRWISMKSGERPSSVVSSVWNRQFAKIGRSCFEQAEAAWEPILDPAVLQWVELTLKALDEDVSRFSMLAVSQKAARGQQWMSMQIALWLLRYEPDRMVDFLRATHKEPYPPINWIEDSLCHLARHFTTLNSAQQAAFKPRLLELFELLAYRITDERLRFVNIFVHDLLPYCTADEVSALYRTIKADGIEVHGFTILHIATRSAREGNYADASEALLHAKDAGVDINRWNYRSACSTVIRSCMTQPEGLRVCLGLVSQLVDAGLQLNGPLCDIIMLNAVDAGDVNTAFSVYRSLVERGLQPRESTFAVLLKGCKLNIDDADMLNGVIRDAISKINVRQSPLVATEILHCLALHHTKHNADSALRTITEAYAQLFDMAPLKLLGLPLPAIQQQRATSEEAMPPTPHALGFMISASIQRIQSYSERPDDIATIYARWRELVEAGHPSLAELAATDHTFNIFLMAFIRNPSGLIHASRVVKDMQRPLTLPAAPPSISPPMPTSKPTSVSTTPPTTREQCKPTVHTWSIFLHGFTRHNKLQLADQVLTYMRKKGIEPNDVTWSTLLLGYARGQDAEGTFDRLRAAEESGYVWSRWTEDAVKWLRDRGRVAREMERRRVERARLGLERGDAFDFTEDIKKGLGEKLSQKGEEEVDGEEASEKVAQPESEERYSYKPNAGFADARDEEGDVDDQRDSFR